MQTFASRLVLLFFLSTCFFLSGCDCFEKDPVITWENYENQSTFKANANHAVLSEYRFGENGKTSSLRRLSPSENNTAFFYGPLANSNSGSTYTVIVNPDQTITESTTIESDNKIGLLASSGASIAWNSSLDYNVRATKSFSQSSHKIANYMINAGKTDNTGILAVYSKQGTLKNKFVLKSESNYTNSWLNDVIQTEVLSTGYVIVAGGGCYINNVAHPLLVRLYVDGETGVMQFPEIKVFPELNGWFSYLTSNNNIQATNYYGLIRNNDTEFNVVGFDMNFMPIWNTPISSSGAEITHRTKLLFENNQIYFGWTSEENTTGVRWDYGTVGSLSALSGQMLWSLNLNPTEYSDRLYDIAFHNNMLWAVGQAAGYRQLKNETLDTDTYRGYGYLAKIEPNSGSVLNHYGFGAITESSGFNAAIIQENIMFAGGWTERKSAISGFKAWYVKIDLSKL